MSTTQTSSPSRAPAALWLYNPWLDLIVGCGAWSAPLLLVAYLSLTSNTLAWSVAFYVLALFFNYPHYMATIYRAYHREADFNRYRIFTVHITFLVLLTAVLTHVWPRALPWIFTLYLTGSPWHYSGQNYGLFMMFARRAGARPSAGERNAVYAAFLLSYAILFVNFHTGPSADPLFISLNLPAGVSSTLQAVLGIAFIGCSAYGLAGLIGQAGWRGMVPSLTLFATQFVWFLLPTALSLGAKVQVPQSRYSTGVLAVMHSAQYLWVTSYYARREAVAEGRDNWRPLAYFGILIAGGIALFVPGPWLASHVFHFDFTRSFLIFTALVNIHHFILDGAIWKLREGRISALLLNTQARASAVARQTGARFVERLRWIAGPAPRARAVRISLASALLLWGAVDQLHYYLALRNDNLVDLQRAARLAAYDTPVQMRLAEKEIAAGQIDAAVLAWKRAIAASPSDPAPRNAYLRYLVGAKHYREAYSLTRTATQSSPHDAQLLLNHGILALQLGHEQEAIQSWQNALANNPNLEDAHLLLAAQFNRDGKAAEAIPHYENYLALVARHGPLDRPPAAQVISVALSLADCQARLNQADSAAHTYDMARKLAFATKEPKLESLGSVSEATLQTRLGNNQLAQQLYQRALFLDDSARDLESERADLYDYASFLHTAGFPARLAYAVLLRAEALQQPGTKFPEGSDQLRKSLEQQLGSSAAELRRDSKAALSEALAAKP
jgi:tetratricopeptide (TPR) repeat protein